MTFIEDCKHWYKLWSVRLAALAGALFSSVIAYPNFFLGLLDRLPAQWRPVASIAGFVVGFGLPTFMRLVKQPDMVADPDA